MGQTNFFSEFSLVLKFAPVDHIEASDADRVTFVRDFDIAFGFPS
jgi:hypothetical protein